MRILRVTHRDFHSKYVSKQGIESDCDSRFVVPFAIPQLVGRTSQGYSLRGDGRAVVMGEFS